MKGSAGHSVHRRRDAFNASSGGRLRGRPPFFCCRLFGRHKKAGSSHPASCTDEPVYRLTVDKQESSNTHPSDAAYCLCADSALMAKRHQISLDLCRCLVTPRMLVEDLMEIHLHHAQSLGELILDGRHKPFRALACPLKRAALKDELQAATK